MRPFSGRSWTGETSSGRSFPMAFFAAWMRKGREWLIRPPISIVSTCASIRRPSNWVCREGGNQPLMEFMKGNSFPIEKITSGRVNSNGKSFVILWGNVIFNMPEAAWGVEGKLNQCSSYHENFFTCLWSAYCFFFRPGTVTGMSLEQQLVIGESYSLGGLYREQCGGQWSFGDQAMV